MDSVHLRCVKDKSVVARCVCANCSPVRDSALTYILSVHPRHTPPVSSPVRLLLLPHLAVPSGLVGSRFHPKHASTHGMARAAVPDGYIDRHRRPRAGRYHCLRAFAVWNRERGRCGVPPARLLRRCAALRKCISPQLPRGLQMGHLIEDCCEDCHEADRESWPLLTLECEDGPCTWYMNPMSNVQMSHKLPESNTCK